MARAVSKGMKAHRNEKGEVVLFRPYDNAKRFNQSAIRMCMPTIPEDLFVNALKELLKVDHNWVPKNPSHSLYIRPFMFATDPYVELDLPILQIYGVYLSSGLLLL